MDKNMNQNIVKAAGTPRVERIKEIEKSSGYLLGMSILFGMLYAFCLYKNISGITYPLLVVCGYALCLSVIHKLDMKVKKESWFIVIISVLLAIATCRTGDMLIIVMNHLAVFLLACIYLLHHFYADGSWSVGKYMEAIVMFLGTALSMIKYPIIHCLHYVKHMKNSRNRHIVMVVVGVGCSIPFVMILIVLLGEADMVFQHAIKYMIDTFFSPWTIVSVTLMICVSAVGMYSLVCSAYVRNLKEEIRDTRVREPLIAVSGLAMIAIVYLIFCSIQVIYLFMGAGRLPEGITYSTYARQGFSQLVFVAFLNVVMVLFCLKYFRKNPVLNVILTIVSGCTYVMLTSAAYRMYLYISEYHLTYLRLLVIWFLALLAMVLAGVVVLIYKNSFPLFRYCLVVVSVFYLGFAWMKPDYVIADYNMNHIETLNGIEIDYMVSWMSVDAAPVVAKIKEEQWKEAAENRIDYYNIKVKPYMESGNLRKYNFSYAEAEKLLGNSAK